MIIIDPTHNGPPGSGHGGVAAGRFAELVDPHRARVRFHAFIPLGVPLTGQRAADGAVAVSDGDTLIATVAPTDPIEPFVDLPVPELDDVAAAEARWYAACRDRHPFPTCFGCGPARPERDGLHLRPGALAGLDVHATTWRPSLDGATPAWLVWAALDCGSAGPALVGMPDGASVVTGELAVDIRKTVPGDATVVIVSRATSRNARKTKVAAALIDPRTGQHYAAATSTWFTIAQEPTP